MGTESNDMGPAKNNDDGTLVTAAIRGIMVLVVPLAGVIGAYYSTRAALEGDIRELRQDVIYLTRSIEDRAKQTHADMDDIRNDLDRHVGLGIGGLPHPTGFVLELERINERLKRLESKVMP